MSERVLLGATVLLSALALTAGRRAGPAATLTTSIVPGDLAGLVCRGRAGEAQCGFDEQGAASGASNPLRPFVVQSGTAVLMRGVFESEAVLAWLASRPAADARVTVQCPVHELLPGGEVAFRFGEAAPWGRAQLRAFDAHDCFLAK